MTKLINWDAVQRSFYSIPKDDTQKAYQRKIANSSRPKEIEDLVKSLTKMWERLGAMDNCTKCHSGQLSRPKEYHGCCGGCPHLTETGCIAKPVGCALFSCYSGHTTGFSDDKRIRFESKIQLIMNFASAAHLITGYYSSGYWNEVEREWTPEQLRAAKLLTSVLDTYLYF